MSPPKVLVIGTGEYVSGLVHGSESTSDKGAGIVALTLFDLRERGLVSDIILTGSNGTKFPLIRAHFDHLITQRYGLDSSFHSFPDDDQRAPQAWRSAIKELSPGDSVLIFTPDDLHFELAHTAAQAHRHCARAHCPRSRANRARRYCWCRSRGMAAPAAARVACGC